MFITENLIRSATRKCSDRLKIVLFNEEYDEYVRRLCALDHDFYIFTKTGGMWSSQMKPGNLTVVPSPENLPIRSYDFVISMNRANAHDKAFRFSSTLHLPVINIDMVSKETIVPRPFMTNLNIKEQGLIFNRKNVCAVGSSREISESWGSPKSFVIPPFCSNVKFGTVSKNKILLDSSMPDDYYKNIRLNKGNPIFTFKPEEAGAYLHLRQYIAPIMYDCLGAQLPIITIEHKEFDGISINKVQNIEQIYNIEIDKLAPSVSDKNLISQNTFIHEWQNVFNNINDSFFTKE